MTAEGRTRCAVLGSPIGHSLSPTLHRAAYAALGLDWTYDRFEVTADGLADFVAGLDSTWRGLSLTMPLKEAVLGLGEVDPVARRAGAGNTLILDDADRRVYNTDVAGLAWAVRRVVPGPVPRVTLLGSGATARSALLAAAELGAAAVTVVARTPAKAEPLVTLGPRARPAGDGPALGRGPAAGRPGGLDGDRRGGRPAGRELSRPARRWSSTSSTRPGPPCWPRPCRGPAGRC